MPFTVLISISLESTLKGDGGGGGGGGGGTNASPIYPGLVWIQELLSGA